RTRIAAVADAGLERLNEPPRRAGVGEDVGLEALVRPVGGGQPDAEHLDLALQRSAVAVVGEVRVDGFPTDERGSVPAYIEDGRHGLAGNAVDREHVCR